MTWRLWGSGGVCAAKVVFLKEPTPQRQTEPALFGPEKTTPRIDCEKFPPLSPFVPQKHFSPLQKNSQMETKKISLPLPPKKRRNQSQNSNGPPSQTAHQICLDMEKDSTFMCAPQPILHPHIGELQHSPLPPTPTATTFRRTHTDKWSPLIRMASRSPKTHVSLRGPAPQTVGVLNFFPPHTVPTLPEKCCLCLAAPPKHSRRRFFTPVTNRDRGRLPWTMTTSQTTSHDRPGDCLPRLFGR